MNSPNQNYNSNPELNVNKVLKVWNNMWNDQEKWVTCRRFSILSFLHYLLATWKCYILMQTALESYIWLQSYEQFIKDEYNIKQKNLDSFLADISKTKFATSTHSSWSCHLLPGCTLHISVFLHRGNTWQDPKYHIYYQENSQGQRHFLWVGGRGSAIGVGILFHGCTRDKQDER